MLKFSHNLNLSDIVYSNKHEKSKPSVFQNNTCPRFYKNILFTRCCHLLRSPLFFGRHSINNNHHQREHSESSVCTDTPIYRKENGRASLPVMVSLVPFRIIIGWPSSLLQVIRGGGWPVARHHRVAFSPSDTERSPLVSSYTISGGTGTGKHSLQNKTVALCLSLESYMYIDSIDRLRVRENK